MSGGLVIGVDVPWNALWTSEDRYEIRPCRWAGNSPAVWSPHSPGVGKPIFAKPHMVRQRKSIMLMLCTVCGSPTHDGHRWWFKLGSIQEGWFMTTEAPVHLECAEHSLKVCPYLRGREDDLQPFPKSYSVLRSLVGGPRVEADFNIKVPESGVIGHLKLAWRV